MAIIKTTIHASLQLTVRTASGTLRADDLIAAIRSYYAGPVTKLILWDFEKADVEEVTADQLHQLVRVTKELLPVREGGKTALVAPSDLAFGLGRMFDSEQEVSSPKVAHKTFRTQDQALEWLFDGKRPVIE
jgi:hypothetical protein